jgi:hypothetical protein
MIFEKQANGGIVVHQSYGKESLQRARFRAVWSFETQRVRILDQRDRIFWEGFFFDVQKADSTPCATQNEAIEYLSEVLQ